MQNSGLHSPSLSINSRALVVCDQPGHYGGPSQQAESIINNSKKLQDDLQELGLKMKRHEDNIKYLKALNNKLEDSILDMQVALGKYHTSSSTEENEDTGNGKSEEEITEQIMKHEKTAAALLCRLKSLPEAQIHNIPFTKDVLGIVATLGKVDDDDLSRVLSEYLGLDTMLGVVCKTYEGVKALEGYSDNGSINGNLGLHAVASSAGEPLADRFTVFCLENIRPYKGAFITDDPQRRLDLIKPKTPSGETPLGFLGFAVNMITIAAANLYCVPKTGQTLRDTLFYKLFGNLQVYRSMHEMMEATPYIPNGAVSLDGGVIKSPGVFLLGHYQGDIDVKFPIESKRPNFPETYFVIENRMKETKWKKDQAKEDMEREQEQLNRVKFNYEIKKQEFVKCLAESSLYATQAGRASTPR